MLASSYGNLEREEGEIVDDDLEAISDDSIIATPRMGKFSSHKENLRALSLSSVSDMEVVEKLPTTFEKRKVRRRTPATCKRRKNSRHHHRHRRRSESSSDSDENVSLTKKLLQEAIRIDTKESHNNSLRTRLRGMVVKPAVPSVEIDSTKTSFDGLQNMIPSHIDSLVNLETGAIENTTDLCEQKDKICQDSAEADQDNELIQLRLEALKTAVLNKFEHRKKRKINHELLQKPSNLEINKENSSGNVNANKCLSDVEVLNYVEENSENNTAVGNSVNNSEEDEDEDILRAVLLASIAKKITSKVSTPSVINNVNTAPVPVKPVKSNHSSQSILPKPKIDLNIPKIPRFIISVNNSDSNSDDNSLRDEIEERRRKKINEKVPNIQAEVENEVDKFLKQQRAEVEAKQKIPLKVPKPIVKPNTQVKKAKIAEANDVYKLLPKPKQLEYETLMQKIQTAQKKPKIKKLSPNKTSDLKNTKAKITFKSSELNALADRKTSMGILQHTLKDIQARTNGRLQIQEKYHILAPLMKKMNEASQEQKKHEMHIYHLLNQLKEARSQYQKSQQHFYDLIKEFFDQKEEIDKRLATKNNISKTSVTSSPKSEEVAKKSKIVPKINIPTSVPQKLPDPIELRDNLHSKVVVEKCLINLTDPTDIEFKNLEVGKAVTVPKYISPLDNNGSTSDKINPLKIFCPFEINGSCRDRDCTFNHCIKVL